MYSYREMFCGVDCAQFVFLQCKLQIRCKYVDVDDDDDGNDFHTLSKLQNIYYWCHLQRPTDKRTADKTCFMAMGVGR
jgi:hypothetical protein